MYNIFSFHALEAINIADLNSMQDTCYVQLFVERFLEKMQVHASTLKGSVTSFQVQFLDVRISGKTAL